MSLAPINDNLLLLAPKDLDTRTGRFTVATGGWRPYNDIAEFMTVIVEGARFENQVFWVRSTTNANRSDLYALDKNKNPIRVVPDVDLSNYYTKGQIDTTVNNLQDQIDTAIIEINGKVNKTGDVITGTTTFSSGQTRFTNVAGRQLLLLGNQDSLGVNKPTIIEGHDGGLGIGYGDSWTDERGGNYTPLLEVTDDELTYKGQDISDLAPVQSVNGRIGVVTGLAEQSSLDATNTAVSQKANTSGQVFTGAISAPNLSGTNTGDQTKSSLGLGNVDNTPDTLKPISVAQQAALDLKVPLLSPVLQGNPTAPTPANGDNSQSIATTAFVQAAASGVTVPDATNTLKGKVKLAGDLGGTADNPTVPGLASKAEQSALTSEVNRATAKENSLQSQIITKADTSSISEIIEVNLASGVSTYTNATYASKTAFLIDITTGGAGAVFKLTFDSSGVANLGFTTSQAFVGLLAGTLSNLSALRINEMFSLLYDEFSTPVDSSFVVNKTSPITIQILVNINSLLRTSNKQVNGIDIKFSGTSQATVIKVNLTSLTYTPITVIPSASIVTGTIQHFDFNTVSFASDETIGVIGALYYNNDATYAGVLYGPSYTSNSVWAFSYLPYIYTKQSRFDQEINAIEADVEVNTDKIDVIESSIYDVSEKEIVSNFQWSSMTNTYSGSTCNTNNNLKGSGLTISKVIIKFSGNTVDGKIYRAVINGDNTFTKGTLLLTIPKAGITIGVVGQYTLTEPVNLASNENILVEGQVYYGGSGMLYPGAIYGVTTTVYSPVFTFSYNLVVQTAINRLDNLGIFDRTPIPQEISEIGALLYQPFIADGYNHVVCYGQSLSMGAESYTALSTTALANTFMLGAKVSVVTGAFSPLRAVQGAGNEMEAPVVGAVNALKTRLDKTYLKDAKYIGSTPGVGGRTIELLSKECTNGVTISTNIYNSRLISTLNACKTNAGATKIVCPVIVFMQGEYNQIARAGEGLTTGSAGTADKDVYKGLLLTLKNNMQADIMSIYGQDQKPLFLTYLTSAKFVGVNDMPATYAQYEFAMENEDVILMNPHYFVPTAHDGSGHMNTNGSRWYGEMIARSIYSAVYKGMRFAPVVPKNYQIYKKSIYIDCYVPCAPLVFDVKTLTERNNYGFNILIGGVEKTISSVSIVGGTTIKIDLPATISGVVTILYGGSLQNGYGNIRDSNNELSFSTYVNENTLTINDVPPYTPVDNDNVTYYGRRYPMWNWLANFKKVITV